MILWLKGVVFNVTTVDLKRWVLLPVRIFFSFFSKWIKKSILAYQSCPGRFHKGFSRPVTLWSSPTSNTLTASQLLIWFSHDPFSGRRKSQINKQRLWRSYFKVPDSAHFLPTFWWATCYFFYHWDQKAVILCDSTFPPRCTCGFQELFTPNPCFSLCESSKCSLNIFPLLKRGKRQIIFSHFFFFYGFPSSSCVSDSEFEDDWLFVP